MPRISISKILSIPLAFAAPGWFLAAEDFMPAPLPQKPAVKRVCKPEPAPKPKPAVPAKKESRPIQKVSALSAKPRWVLSVQPWPFKNGPQIPRFL